MIYYECFKSYFILYYGISKIEKNCRRKNEKQKKSCYSVGLHHSHLLCSYIYDNTHVATTPKTTTST